MIKVDMNKLYVLYCCQNKDQDAYIVAASNQIRKLEQVGASSCWTIINDPNREYTKRETEEGKYPFYLIREIPYVC